MAGVLGAYALLHPAARVLSLIVIIFFVTLVEVPALLLLGIWRTVNELRVLGDVRHAGARRLHLRRVFG